MAVWFGKALIALLLTSLPDGVEAEFINAADPCNLADQSRVRVAACDDPRAAASLPETPLPPREGGANPEFDLQAASPIKERPWLDTSKTIERRVDSLVRKLTLDEKVGQLESSDAKPVKRLGISAFRWQRECLHGMVGDGEGTMFPSPLAWAATFDDELVEQAASAIGDEMRAYNNQNMRSSGKPSHSFCFATHTAIARDPRWGRTSETYGEDPHLSALMAGAFVRGLQGRSSGPGSPYPGYLKVGATCKHVVGQDLEEWGGFTRNTFDAKIDARDMRDTYMVPYEACVQNNVSSIMCSYNKVNGMPACLSKALLTDTLRKKWGFRGFVSTDCFALQGYASKPPKGMGYGTLRSVSAAALKAGSDLACPVGRSWEGLGPGDARAEIDAAVRRVMSVRFRLGHFDPPNRQPYNYLPRSTLMSPGHLDLARKLAAESVVLLKNTNAVLPLNPAKLRRLAVIGPFADDEVLLLGNYYTVPQNHRITMLGALRAALPRASVTFNADASTHYTQRGVARDAASCQAADACILFLGHRMHLYAKHRHNEKANSYLDIQEGETHDRTSLKLERNQALMWKEIAKRTTKPLIVVLIHGGGIDISDMLSSTGSGGRVGAVLTAFFPGQGAHGVADILLGKTSPSGRLPVTWYRDSYTRQLPMTDSRMRATRDGRYPGRTYRYWRGPAPLLPFGFGLSYTRFMLHSPAMLVAKGAAQPFRDRGTRASITLLNAGNMKSDHVVLLFMSFLGQGLSPPGAAVIPASGCARGRRSSELVQRLVGHRRVRGLAPGATQRLEFSLSLEGGSFSSWAGFGDPAPPCGVYSLRFGHDQPAKLYVALRA